MQNIYASNEADKPEFEYAINQCDEIKKILLSVSDATLPAYDEMTSAEFDKMMASGLAQAKDNDSCDIDEVFDELESVLAEQ